MRTALMGNGEIERNDTNRDELTRVINGSESLLPVDRNFIFAQEFAPPVAAELGRRAADSKTKAERIPDTHKNVADFADIFPNLGLYPGMNLAWMQRSGQVMLNDRANYDLGHAYAIAQQFDFSLSDACLESLARIRK